jgi:hypothetical protein
MLVSCEGMIVNTHRIVTLSRRLQCPRATVHWFSITLLLVGISSGCISSKPAQSPTRSDSATETNLQAVHPATRDNAIALLYELLNDEQHLSKILIIKSESPALKQVVKDISDAAANGVKVMTSLEKGNPALEKGQNGLPAGEKAAREAIAKASRNQLLESSGSEFELQLLLTQVQGLRYGSHLARVIAENEQIPERVLAYKKVSVQLKMLEEQVVGMIRKSG